MPNPKNIIAPIRTPMVDPKTGMVTPQWTLFFQSLADKINSLYTQVNP